MTRRTYGSRSWASLLALATATFVATAVRPPYARASVVEHEVTPTNADETDGVEVAVRRRANGDVVLTLTVERAPMAVDAPRLRRRPGAEPSRIAWRDAGASPLVAELVIDARDRGTAVVTVMRDFGLVGHHYTIRAADWAPPD